MKRIFSGDTANPLMDTLRRIVSVLGGSLDDLFAESKMRVHSVFDYLYHNYADAREDAMRKYGRVSEVDSENLMHAVIRDVLSKSDYSKYDVVMHVPLRMILSD